MNLASLFPHGRTEPAQELHRLAQRRGELITETRELGEAVKTTERERDQAGRQARAAEVEAHALGGADTAPIAKARKEIAALDKRLAGLTERHELATAAVEHIDREIRRHATEHIDEIMEELREDADAAQTELADALEAASAAHAAWQQVSTRVTQILVLAELARDHHPPQLPQRLDEVARRIGRHAHDVPAPFPRSWHADPRLQPTPEPEQQPAAATVYK